MTENIAPPQLAAIYLGLTWEQKALWQRFSVNIQAKDAATFLRCLAANLIPQGYYRLAEQLLNQALPLACDNWEKAWLYANLYQIAADQYQSNLCADYCQKVLETGHLTQWAETTLADLTTESTP